MNKNLNFLFLHFPVDNNQIESKTLPDYFASKKHNVFSMFEKGDRKFYSIHTGINKPIIQIEKEKLKDVCFDAIISKNNSYQKYGKYLKTTNSVVINVTPMGFDYNKRNCDFFFEENELIKAPVKEMQEVFDKNFIEWKDRKKQVLIPASIGSDKNQKEIVDLINADYFKEYSFLFAGKIYNQQYANYLYEKLKSKGIKSEFKLLSRRELAYEFINSRLTMLTTDPRPAQPFDPGPRVIFESIRAGTPCIINDLVLINNYCAPYCSIYQNKNKKMFDLVCNEFVNRDNDILSKRCYNDGKKYLTINFACQSAYKRIMTWLS